MSSSLEHGHKDRVVSESLSPASQNVFHTFKFNYYCPCGNKYNYGRKVYAFTSVPGLAGSSSTPAPEEPSSIELKQNFLDGILGIKPSPRGNEKEDGLRRLKLLEKLHREALKDKEDTIANLREVILEHEKKVLDVGSIADGNINSHQPSRSTIPSPANSTQKLLDQMEVLQKEKDALRRKVADLEARQLFNDPNSYSFSTEISENAEMPYQDSSCSTDTEKELEKMKREKFFVEREMTRLRKENGFLQVRLHDHGEDLSDICAKRGGQQSSKLDEVFYPSSRQVSGETTPDGLGDSGYMEGASISSLDGQIIHLQQELQQNAGELRLAHARNDTSEIARLSVVNAKLQEVVRQLYEEFQELKAAYFALRNDMNSSQSSQEVVIAQICMQVQKTLMDIEKKHQEVVQKYLREMKLRKKFHNQLVELRGNIRVFCRVRPWIKEDGHEEDAIVVTLDPTDDSLLIINNKGSIKYFESDKAFGMHSTQTEVFEEVSALVRSVVDGYNVCIFAYGQTGSGKTYTMEGPKNDPGINQRALQLLFEETTDNNWHYEITASVMEIYNEAIRDLLNPDPENKLEVKMKPEGGLHVPGLVLVPVSTLTDVNQIFETGCKNRATASTNMNEHSSRSHCLLCVTVTGQNLTTGSKSLGRLNLVDLAGSERVSKSQADGIHLKEAQAINKSLSCLGDVIHALRNKHNHVPYRNSKLTYLLQDSLGGDSKTLMIVQVAPVEKNVCETVCTLTFGQRVRAVELGAATKNIDGSKGTPTSKRPLNLIISPYSISATSSPATSPGSSKSHHSPLTSASSSPNLNGKKTLTPSSSTATLISPSSSRRSLLMPKSPSPGGRKLPSTLRTSASPKIIKTDVAQNLSKAATALGNLDEKSQRVEV